MRTPLTLGLALLLAAGTLSGCGNKSALTGPAPSDGATGASMEQAAVAATLAATPELIDDAVFEDPTQVAIGGGAPGALAAIRPLRFWRVINDVDRRFEFAFSDSDSTGRPTTARVTVHRFMSGSFNILHSLSAGLDAAPDTDSVAVVRKPLADHGVRHLLLKRVPLGNSGETGWRVAATSGVRITSFDPRSTRPSLAYGATRIVSLRVQADGLDTTITDPLALFRLRAVIALQPTGEVTLTATTEATDDIVVLLWRGLRFRFANNGDHTYTGKWKAPLMRGVGHVGVNALAHGTLFDDVAPYDSQAWVLPFRVRPTELPEYMP
jgi:hypothetical protein